MMMLSEFSIPSARADFELNSQIKTARSWKILPFITGTQIPKSIKDNSKFQFSDTIRNSESDWIRLTQKDKGRPKIQ